MNIIEKIQNILQDSSITETKAVDTLFFQIEQVKEQKERYKMIIDSFKEIRNSIKDKSFRVLPWKNSELKHEKNNLDLQENSDYKDEIFVIEIEDKPTYYLLTEEGKIKSMFPIIKGDLIIGWM